MFFGRYRHTLDEKGRLTIPARYRDIITDGAFITQGFDQNLMVLTAADFEIFSQRISRISITDPDVRDLRRMLFSSADRVEPDKNGRILIPQFLRDLIGMDGEAMLIGVGDFFEIWSIAEWEIRQQRLNDIDANSQRFIGMDLSIRPE